MTTTRILVLYGTGDGQTRKISLVIGEVLRSSGFDVDVVDASAESPSVDPYAGVIVAASVHAGGYQRPVLRWVAAHKSALDKLPNVFVSVCLGVLEHNPKTDAALAAIRNAFYSMSGWQPAECRVMAGALKYRSYNWFKRRMMRRIAAKAGGDTDTSRDHEYTDWDDVRAFAGAFGQRVRQAQVAT